MKLLFTTEALASYNDIKASSPREAEQIKEVLKDVLEHAVLDLVAALVQNHEAGLVTHGRGFRGNEFLGHLGVKF